MSERIISTHPLLIPHTFILEVHIQFAHVRIPNPSPFRFSLSALPYSFLNYSRLLFHL